MCPSSTVLRVALSRLFSGVLLLIPWGSQQGITGLRLLNLHVPTSVMQGESVWLNCTLDMESDELYSVKWYKSDVEFYRYLPRDSPRGQKYDLPGVFVDLGKSRQGSVFLQTTDLNSEGLYRCEASAESPTFQTVEGEKQMNVYVLPQEGPSIHGNLHKYEIGDFVNVTCRSGPSKPAATLIWFINGKEVPPEFIAFSSVIDHLNGLQTSTLGLAFVVSSLHLGLDGSGAITLRCTSIVSQTYSMSSEELVVGDKIPEISSTSGTRVPLINQLYSRDGPVISGGRFHYRVGDLLNINCSSSKSRSAPELQWFLNDQKVDNFDLIKYPVTRYPDRQEKSTLGLRFKVSPIHFDEQEEMRLKCTATLSEVINMRSDEKTVGGNHRGSGLHVSENIGKVSERNYGTIGKSRISMTFLLSLLATWKGL